MANEEADRADDNTGPDTRGVAQLVVDHSATNIGGNRLEPLDLSQAVGLEDECKSEDK